MNEDLWEMVTIKVAQLTRIWSNLGMSCEPTRRRLERTRNHIATLLDEMLESETGMRERLLQNVTELSDEVQQLPLELSVPSPAVSSGIVLLLPERPQ